MTYANHEKIRQLVMASLSYVGVDNVGVDAWELAREYADRDTVFSLSIIAAFYVDQLVQFRPDMSHEDAVQMLGECVESAPWPEARGQGGGP